jgi:cation-transporting ATPase E
VARGDVNTGGDVKTRSIRQILLSNICTLFNAINVILAGVVLFTGSYKNMLFMLVITCNVAIGIFQEIRSKRTTDKLSIIASSKAKVLRDGVQSEIALEELVKDDLIMLGRGDQVPSDALVVAGTCQVNESLLTGESKLVPKAPGSELMSGSFVNAGMVTARVVNVGAENYAARISAQAKQYKKINSEIMNTLNNIIKFVSIAIFPVGAALFARGYFLTHQPFNDTLLTTVAALVGMIPEGLILLTSTVLAVSVIRLAQSKVLVQQLYCIETLARVDTLCLDKTGTITTGSMVARSVVGLGGYSAHDAGVLFATLAAADPDPNETARAISAWAVDPQRAFDDGGGAVGSPHTVASANDPRQALGSVPPVVSRVIPFSSERKYSGAVLADGTAYCMGAAQFVMGECYPGVAGEVEALAANARVLLLARVDGFDEHDEHTGEPVALGLVALCDEIRSTAAQTIRYFVEQGVTLKVISGDDPHTVSGIACEVGIPGGEVYVDATTLTTDEQIANAAERYHVFGRVKPEQKKQLVIELQKCGHIVAMTGDGVNDTLALKQSDCSVAMASGSDAARNVAQLVLVDNDFASMPKVVAEGRRSINNLQRSASLFLVKTLLSISLASVFIFLPWQYPFQPIQMTLISAFTIGVPSFVLALEPNRDRIKGHFLQNVIVRSIPSALTVFLAIMTVNILGDTVLGMEYTQVSTLSVLLMAWTGCLLIVRLCLPFTPLRAALVAVIVGGTILGATVFGSLFGIVAFTPAMAAVLSIGAVVTAVLFNVLYHLLDTWQTNRLAKLV